MATTTPLTLAQGPATQPHIEYRVSFPNRDHHEAEVVAVFSNIAPAPLVLRMARSSPGRYALHEFARHVSRVRATDGNGVELFMTRPDEHSWQIDEHGGAVIFSYTVFGDHADGTYNGIDNTHAHLHAPATFIYAPGYEQQPRFVRFDLPADTSWTIATALNPTDNPSTFSAPDLHTLMDSPIELSNHDIREWDQYRLAVHHDGSDQEVDLLAQLLRRVIAQHHAIFGEVPRFENGRYLFMVDALPWVFDDAMEHRNSCVITVPGPMTNTLAQVLAKASHEFFHAWSMERLRPHSLEPFDYGRANASPELWFGEGFAGYYGPLALVRAGIANLEQYTRTLAPLLDGVFNSPGRHNRSVLEMSLQAPFTDAAAFVDAPAQPNSYTSYEAWGAVLALALDLTLRTEKQRTLDQFMRLLWQRFGRSEIPYTNDDLETTLAELSGDSVLARSFFQRFIYGTELPDLVALLSRAGLLLRRSASHTPTLGMFWGGMQNGKLFVGSHTTRNTSLYDAGIDRGDIILELDGTAIRTPADIQNIIAGRPVGATVEIRYIKRGELRTRMVALAESSALEMTTFEAAGLQLTPSMHQLRNEWLNGG